MGTTTKLLRAVAVTATLIAGLGAAQAGSFMPTGGLSTQPVGHYEFCQRYPAECTSMRAAQPIELTHELWAAMIDINNRVNAAVFPRTDMEIWGVEERWSYPTNAVGDCEDYVLQKRQLLMQAGVPASNLLVTVVRQPNGDGHAVLTVSTSHGDFILDNLEARVLAWTDTEYRYLKRQSAKHAGMWVSIDDGRDVLVGSVASQ